MSAQLITHALNKYYFDSELFLTLCEDIQATQKDHSKSLLDNKLTNLDSMWNKLYESYREVLLSRNDSITPEIKQEVRDKYEVCTETYYQSGARIFNIMKKLDNPVNHTLQSARSSHRHPSLHTTRYRCLQMHVERPVEKTEITEYRENTNPQNYTQQDCSTDKTLDTTAVITENCTLSNEKNLSNPDEIQPTQSSASIHIEILHRNFISDITPAATHTAISQFVGGRDLPQGVEHSESKSIPISFIPIEDECSSRPSPTPSSIPLDYPTDKTAKKSIIVSRVVHSRALPHQTGQNPVLTQWRITKSIYHWFTLRWYDYLIHLPKQHRWKHVLIGGSGSKNNPLPDEDVLVFTFIHIAKRSPSNYSQQLISKF